MWFTGGLWILRVLQGVLMLQSPTPAPDSGWRKSSTTEPHKNVVHDVLGIESGKISSIYRVDGKDDYGVPKWCRTSINHETLTNLNHYIRWLPSSFPFPYNP